MNRGIRALALAAILFLAHPGAVTAADVPVPVQLALFEKIWKLDRSFPPRQEIVLAVLYQESYEASTAAKGLVLEWGRRNKVRCAVVVMDEKDAWAALKGIEADVFYVAPMRGANIEEIARIAKARQIRTMAGLSEYVPLGISIGIGVRNDRPLILVNLDAARAEGAAYQAQLLQLAEIVRGRR
ncbi:MAG: YfiR family protein [Acidobacteriota bacterium]